MQLLQQAHNYSEFFNSFLVSERSATEYETSAYIEKGGSPAIFVYGIIPPRNLAETSTILSVTDDIKLLKKVYVFREIKKIESYLWNNKFLIDILFDAHMQIVNIFRKSAELHLELHRDYEEDFEELFIVIKSPTEPTHMLDFLDRLDEEWFLDISDKTLGKLNITVESL
jgi:hypothetical protein